MKWSDLTEKVQLGVREIIKDELLMRGIKVDVTCNETKNELLKIKTSTIQTTPVIFKELYIEGTGFFDQAANGMDELVVCLDYRWQSFTNGYNGTSICHIYILLSEYEARKRYTTT